MSFGKQTPNGYKGPPDWRTLENLASWTQTLKDCFVFAPAHQAGAPVLGWSPAPSPWLPSQKY